jgi:hypothetical protein
VKPFKLNSYYTIPEIGIQRKIFSKPVKIVGLRAIKFYLHGILYPSYGNRLPVSVYAIDIKMLINVKIYGNISGLYVIMWWLVRIDQ